MQEHNLVRESRHAGGCNGEALVLHEKLASFSADTGRLAVILQRGEQGAIAGAGLIEVSAAASATLMPGDTIADGE